MYGSWLSHVSSNHGAVAVVASGVQIASWGMVVVVWLSSAGVENCVRAQGYALGAERTTVRGGERERKIDGTNPTPPLVNFSSPFRSDDSGAWTSPT